MIKKINKKLLWGLFSILLCALIGLKIGFANEIRLENLLIELFTLILFFMIGLLLIREYKIKYKRYLQIQLIVNTFTLLVTSIYTYFAFAILLYASIFSANISVYVVQFLTGVLISLTLVILECIIIVQLKKI